MKTTSFLLVMLGIFPLASFPQHAFGENAQSAPPAQQQQPPSIPADSAAAKAKRPGGGHDGPFKHFFEEMGALSEPERQQLLAAIEKARNDAEVVKLRESADKIREQLRGAMRDALLRADPTLEPVLTKMRNSIKSKLDEGRKSPDGPHGKRLPEDVRKRLDAAREQAKTYPLVTQAKSKLDAATTREERAAAAKELRAAYRTVILNIDPTLEPYLKSLDKRGRKHGTSPADNKPKPTEDGGSLPAAPPVPPEQTTSSG